VKLRLPDQGVVGSVLHITEVHLNVEVLDRKLLQLQHDIFDNLREPTWESIRHKVYFHATTS
jgi:hypothetical protein